MHIRPIALLVIMLFCSVTAIAQKVKYKDIFALLKNKQYDAAEPLLKKYIETETDNPNAFLYLGIILTEKFDKMQTEEAKSSTVREAARDYLVRAKMGITEKEVSRNEEYYAIYKRRNLRTGKIEITLSDIITDIDNRLAKVSED